MVRRSRRGTCVLGLAAVQFLFPLSIEDELRGRWFTDSTDVEPLGYSHLVTAPTGLIFKLPVDLMRVRERIANLSIKPSFGGRHEVVKLGTGNDLNSELLAGRGVVQLMRIRYALLVCLLTGCLLFMIVSSGI